MQNSYALFLGVGAALGLWRVAQAAAPDEALRRVDQGSDADYTLTYDKAEILEDLNRNEEALRHFRRVTGWNGAYRDAAKRVRILERLTG